MKQLLPSFKVPSNNHMSRVYQLSSFQDMLKILQWKVSIVCISEETLVGLQLGNSTNRRNLLGFNLPISYILFLFINSCTVNSPNFLPPTCFERQFAKLTLQQHFGIYGSLFCYRLTYLNSSPDDPLEGTVVDLLEGLPFSIL